jgi:putative transposase
MPQPASHRLRTGRHSEPGRIYLVTFTTRGRLRRFCDWERARTAASALAAEASWPTARLLCWVLMPDHWHGLVQLEGGENLGRVVGRAKAVTTRALREAGLANASPWARSFHDHGLRREENMRRMARYIVANPVRAGLVRRVGDYPFWDAVWLR